MCTLRFGAVARGGIRWSDRTEDFRTEILGLVKAQAVKNAVIVPVGAKGGFVVRRPPVPTGDAGTDREATRAAGVACYREFISALLDLTDDVAPDGSVRPAPGLVRRDGDDTYLVVAADKGTAAFSDIANEVAADHGFWLGDAFASGGSVGYDNKAMGITARGAWESVRRHFLELDLDVDTDDFTVVGVGDMSGDVFGNGMLLSEHIGLVAAFDHRHVFVDPTPDRARATEQRRRLFAMPRSSWADYDTDAISEGGGVWSRETKSIPVSPQMRAALGIDEDVASVSPPEMITAILRAPVDLLWNGGIGTYVKATSESHADVGDKANDAIRVDAPQVRARVIGEGGNLGVTERGRVEFDLHGGRINSDALDNSAGVDCSDHEVNIKILLDAAVAGRGSRCVRAQRAPGVDDRRGRAVGVERQHRQKHSAGYRAGAECVDGGGARPVAASPRARARRRPGTRGAADRAESGSPRARPRPCRPHLARARHRHGARQARGEIRAAAGRSARQRRLRRRLADISRCRCAIGSPRGSAGTDCAAR